MKIGIVYSTGFPPDEGIGTYVWNLAQSLNERGHELTLITRGDGSVQRHNGIQVHETRYYRMYPFHTYIHRIFIDQVLKEKNLDILHIHSPLSLPAKTDLPIISTVHTPIETSAELTRIHGIWSVLEQITARTVSRRVEKRLISESRKVTGVSSSVCEILDEKYGTSSMVLPNAINEDEFTPGDRTDEYFLYVGRLAPRKGLQMLVRAFDEVSEKNSTTTLRIVGTGQLESKLKQMVSARGLESTVEFEGFVSDERLKELYRNAYCLTLPSRMEGLPTVALEALASGTPVIATDVIGNRDIINDNENGLLVPQDPGSFANDVLRIQRDTEFRDALASNTRNSVVPDYTWSKVGERAEEMYHETING